jgi:beta-fructofuranosidase
MLLGSGITEGERHGQVLRYESDDATRWTYAGVLFEAPRELAGLDLGEHWECPQLVWGDDGSVALIVSCQDPAAARPLMHSVAFVGTLRDGRFDGELQGLLDHGDVFYAPAVCAAEDGRTLLWGWMQERLDPERQAQLSHAGALSLPRQVTVRDGRLGVVLPPEVGALRREPLRTANGSTAAPAFAACAQVELSAEVRGHTGRAAWNLTADDRQNVEIAVDLDRAAVEVTVLDPADGERSLTAPLTPGPQHRLRVLVDGSLLEVIADDGCALSTRAYPQTPWRHARLTAEDGASVLGAEGWALRTEVIS